MLSVGVRVGDDVPVAHAVVKVALGGWVGGWVGGLGRGDRGGSNEVLYVLYGWVGGWVSSYLSVVV